MNRTIYVDNAATTPVSEQVLESMLPYLKEGYGNPSSIYTKGREAKQALDDARTKVADALGAQPEEIFFTSCGTEADNWADRGAALRGAQKGKRHIVTTAFEHHAILHTVAALERQGFEATYLKPDEQGLIRAEDVAGAIREDTAIVTIMYANNEIGTVMPIAEIGKICRERGVLFHTDAVQAIGNLPVNVVKDQVDMLSLSGHKLRAPKGVGALYLRKGVGIDTFMEGGAQERGRRAGTENVAGIVALGTAIEYAVGHLEERVAHELALRECYLDTVLSTIPRCRLNGSRTQRLPGNTNISFEGIEGEGMLLMLDMHGICASSGSACTSGSLDPSHVLMSIGLPHEIAHGSLRVTFGDQNTQEELDIILDVLPKVVSRLRSMSPLWEKIAAEDR